jgi:hypothetical protein
MGDCSNAGICSRMKLTCGMNGTYILRFKFKSLCHLCLIFVLKFETLIDKFFVENLLTTFCCDIRWLVHGLSCIRWTFLTLHQQWFLEYERTAGLLAFLYFTVLCSFFTALYCTFFGLHCKSAAYYWTAAVKGSVLWNCICL